MSRGSGTHSLGRGREPGNHRQVIGGLTRGRAPVDEHALESPAWPHPDSVEREERLARREGRGGRRLDEEPVEPSQRPAPQEPLVDVADQNINIAWLGGQAH